MSTRYFTCNCHLNPDVVCRHDNDPFNARRVRTDWTVADFNGLSQSQVDKINESNERYNKLAESIEEMNISIAMRQIDEGTYDRPVKKTKKRKSKRPTNKELFEDMPEEIKGDLEEFGFDFE
jgi:hypothetical protein|tara:strand:- start:772 stop:1137 length:366 start_codon:yes stop_codon:yes gene_type:complete